MFPKRLLPFVIVLVLLLVGCQKQTAVPTPDILSGGNPSAYQDTWSETFKGEIEWGECTFDAYDADPQCGYLTVPQDYAEPNNGKTLRLGFAVYKTKGTEPKADPLIMVAGFPLTTQSGFMPYVFKDLYETRDMVILDLRGTGLSEPSLACPEMNQAVWDAYPMGGLSPEEWGQQHEKCRQALETQTVDLNSYNLANFANDIKALRLALGYAEWNLFALEPFGAYVVFEQLRADSDGVHSIILDSVLPNYSDQPGDLSAASKALTEMFTLCAQDEKCNDMFPNLESVFYEVVDHLNDAPIKVTAKDTSAGRRTELTADGNFLVELVLSGLLSNDTERIGEYPRMIYQLKDGVYEVFTTLAGSQLSGSDYSYDGLYSLTFCRQWPYPGENAYNQALSSLPSGLSIYFEEQSKTGRANCEAWSPLAVAASPAPSTNFAPILLINGGWNWRQAAAGDVERFAKSSPDAKIVTIPAAGQFNAFFSRSTTCAQQIITNFVEKPDAQVDTSCMPTDPNITWITLH
jgi:pimeloyl-ACP methyl ester carboxylesterase